MANAKTVTEFCRVYGVKYNNLSTTKKNQWKADFQHSNWYPDPINTDVAFITVPGGEVSWKPVKKPFAIRIVNG
jgi:hypothetical protein